MDPTVIILLLTRNPLKEQFIKVVQLEKSVEQINQLETEGGFYTEKEMKDVLKFTATPGKYSDSSCVAFYAFSMLQKDYLCVLVECLLPRPGLKLKLPLNVGKTTRSS